jgi:hypothetical protein
MPYVERHYFHTAAYSHVDKYVDCLERNAGLQSLQVTDIAVLERDPISWLASLLRSFAGAIHLKEIILEFFVPTKWAETVYWHPIDEVFQNVAFPGLVKVDIDFIIPGGSVAPLPSQKEINANAPSQFPCLHRRGILKVTPIRRSHRL